MLYLKEYYSFNSYSKVDISEFRKRPNVVIEPGILEKILSIVKNNNLLSDCTYYDHYICFNTNEVGIDISVDSDDWFKVSILYFSNGSESEYKGEQLYYLCDQYEGLLEFFKDVVKIKIDLKTNENIKSEDVRLNIKDLFYQFEDEYGYIIRVDFTKIVPERKDWCGNFISTDLRSIYGEDFINYTKETILHNNKKTYKTKDALTVRLTKTNYLDFSNDDKSEQIIDEHWEKQDSFIRKEIVTIKERAKAYGYELFGIMGEWYELGECTHDDYLNSGDYGKTAWIDAYTIAFVKNNHTKIYEKFYKPSQSILNKINSIVKEVEKEFKGGRMFFTVLDEAIKDVSNEDMIIQLLKGKEKEWVASSGGFGRRVLQLYEEGKIKCRGVVVFNGKMTTYDMGVYKYFPEFNLSNKKFVYVDDSYFSGKTAEKINNYLSLRKSRISTIEVIYDGSKDRKNNVKSFFRYYK